MAITHLVPGRPAPDLQLPLLGGKTFDLATTPIRHMQLIIFYRGRFCVVCQKYLPALAQLRTSFEALGVDVLAASADSEKDAREASDSWSLAGLPLGYGLAVDDMRRWGAYVSQGDVSLGQPEIFAEPSLYLVKPDRSIFFVTLNSAPGGRPNLDELLDWVTFVISKPGYPTRGNFLATE